VADERDELDALLQGVRVNEGSYEDQGAGGFDAALVARARSLRARERKLAELAREMRSWMIESRDCGYFMSDFEIEWLQRMQKELGP
jgi:hypothetical protein